MYKPHLRPVIKLPKPVVSISRDEIEKYNTDLLNGRGIFDRLKGHVKKFGSKVISTIEKYIKPNVLIAYQKVANQLRKNIKGARPLEVGELHPWGYNFLGPGTKIEKYKNVKPINELDAVAKVHDIEYKDSKTLPPNQQKLAVQRLDEEMVNSITPEMEELPFGKFAKNLMLAKNVGERVVTAILNKPTTFYG